MSSAGCEPPDLTTRSMVLLQGTRKGGRISVVSRHSADISRPACIQGPPALGRGFCCATSLALQQ